MKCFDWTMFTTSNADTIVNKFLPRRKTRVLFTYTEMRIILFEFVKPLSVSLTNENFTHTHTHTHTYTYTHAHTHTHIHMHTHTHTFGNFRQKTQEDSVITARQSSVLQNRLFCLWRSFLDVTAADSSHTWSHGRTRDHSHT